MAEMLGRKNVVQAFAVGIVMGISNLVPGVSAATMAFLLGIYARLMLALSNLFMGRISKKDLLLIALVAGGILIGLTGFAGLISRLLALFPHATYGTFCGLIIGGIPRFVKPLGRGNSKVVIWLLVGLGAVLLFSLVEASPSDEGAELLDRSVGKLAYDMAAGFFGAASLILPGLSGALVLLIMGVYERALNAISEFELVILAFLGAGIIAGIVVMSLVMKKLLSNHRMNTTAFLTGLMIGSIPLLLKRVAFTENLPVFLIALIVATILSLTLFKLSPAE